MRAFYAARRAGRLSRIINPLCYFLSVPNQKDMLDSTLSLESLSDCERHSKTILIKFTGLQKTTEMHYYGISAIAVVYVTLTPVGVPSVSSSASWILVGVPVDVFDQPSWWYGIVCTSSSPRSEEVDSWALRGFYCA